MDKGGEHYVSGMAFSKSQPQTLEKLETHVEEVTLLVNLFVENIWLTVFFKHVAIWFVFFNM